MSDEEEQIDEREEALALGRIAHAIACYRSDALGEIQRWERSAGQTGVIEDCNDRRPGHRHSSAALSPQGQAPRREVRRRAQRAVAGPAAGGHRRVL